MAVKIDRWKVAKSRASPILPPLGRSRPKFRETLSPLDPYMYTKFGPDRLGFAGVIHERLVFRTLKSLP